MMVVLYKKDENNELKVIWLIEDILIIVKGKYEIFGF